jgi:hypothetical protein
MTITQTDVNAASNSQYCLVTSQFKSVTVLFREFTVHTDYSFREFVGDMFCVYVVTRERDPNENTMECCSAVLTWCFINWKDKTLKRKPREIDILWVMQYLPLLYLVRNNSKSAAACKKTCLGSWEYSTIITFETTQRRICNETIWINRRLLRYWYNCSLQQFQMGDCTVL